jgi:hypothetical protein
MPGRICRVQGELYHAAPEVEACDGCAGDDDAALCDRLPLGCSNGAGHVWLRSNENAGTNLPAQSEHVTALTYKPAHGGYPGEVRLT